MLITVSIEREREREMGVLEKPFLDRTYVPRRNILVRGTNEVGEIFLID